ncbi:MAG: enoyl-CoA hydratase-related protein [Desulfobacterales bacterium]
MGESEALRIERKGEVVVLKLNRPKVMNALNFSLLIALKDEIARLQFAADVRAIIITGEGEKAFCAGADLKERSAMDTMEVKKFIVTIRNLFTAIEQLNKPVIAAINGVSLGGGTELALACDIRIASDNASLGLTETRLAIIPGAGGTQRLPRLIGPGKAKELIFTGRRIYAQEALEIGLVNLTCPDASLMSECYKMAGMICETGPIAIEQAKYAINFGIQTDIQTGLAIESNAYWITVPTEDRVEALNAFREKRKPVFKGR